MLPHFRTDRDADRGEATCQQVSSVLTLLAGHGGGNVRRKRGTPLFDDRSAHVDRFGLLLFVTATTVVVLSLVDLTAREHHAAAQIGMLVATILVGVTLLLALRASGLVRRWQRIADLLVLFVVIALMAVLVISAATSLGAPANGGYQPLIIVALAALAPIVVVHRLLKHRRVVVGTLLGAISAYLLIPVAFFYVFTTVNAYQGTPFFGQEEPTTSFMYFSLTTLTTVGYGDLAAVTPLGRLLAASEAVIGQVYLVTFVAMLVALFASRFVEKGGGEPG
jgi:hypothetical protein